MVIIVFLALFVIIVHGLLVRDGMPPEENVRNNSRMTKRKQSSKIEMDKVATPRRTNNEHQEKPNTFSHLPEVFVWGAKEQKGKRRKKRKAH